MSSTHVKATQKARLAAGPFIGFGGDAGELNSRSSEGRL